MPGTVKPAFGCPENSLRAARGHRLATTLDFVKLAFGCAENSLRAARGHRLATMLDFVKRVFL
jgi:hypothetical protein